MDLSSRNTKLGMKLSERIRRRGYTNSGDKVWSAEDDEIVKSLYPSYTEMKLRLPERSMKSLHWRSETLGIAKKLHLWRGSEITKLRRLYTTASRAKIIEEFPQLTWRAIEAAAVKRGFRRAPREHKRTGHYLMDSILARIESIGWTLRDLDEESKTGKYFRTCGWRRYRPNLRKLDRAIRVLGGRLVLEWRT